MNDVVDEYIHGMWKARYFWFHLAMADIRAKYRRSALGILWAVLFPLGLTLLLSVVMGSIFKTPIASYAPYVYSGIVVWEFVTGCAIAGCTAIINAEIYIKQYAHPLAIYPLRYALATLINFGFAFIGMVLWILFWQPSNINLSWVTLPLSTILLFMVGWPAAIITSFVNTVFRDFQQLATLGLQAVWYISPVFIDEKVFQNSQLSFLVHYNPVYHLLNLFRAPLLRGEFPQMANVTWVVGTIMALWLMAIALIRHRERRLIFYL